MPSGRRKWVENMGYFGCKLTYSPRRRAIRIYTKSYIEAIYKKFDVENALKRPPMAPMATGDSGVLVANQEPYKKPFDYRSAVGSIQWCSTAARPDTARPVNLMAKWNNEAPTKNRVTALLKIIAYLFLT